ncbi:hypothetical protein GCM10011613_21790 [Cellvibrio zantedeschiae]|uniref:Uncharacterized protein n=1 Tax=Cellvibrio zantedeschiae TaxID=1237077 RepID=A0ABQ3B3C2_9GAMM|nr:hypothetical protein GCM10011613_21790 [Cellvibrio zantedeschiae]
MSSDASDALVLELRDTLELDDVDVDVDLDELKLEASLPVEWWAVPLPPHAHNTTSEDISQIKRNI